jgi:acyl dehydratase
MPTPLHIPSVNALKDFEGRDLGTTEWRVIPQRQIDAFAEATGDRQWIHVDNERAKRESPYEQTIAHGYLTIALAPVLLPELLEVAGCRQVVNYGIDKLRLKAPVPSEARLRMAATLKKVRILRDGAAHVTFALRYEVDGSKRPACVADAIYVYYPT